MKLKWRVAPVPTGRYRSFEERMWPEAMYRNEDESAAVRMTCEDEYKPQDVRDGNHRPLTIYVAHWVDPAERAGRAAFEWRKVIQTAATLKQAKALAQKILDDRVHFWPEGVE
ncbi:MAG: hypothetical protein GY794_16110 [bacterium]|nr:hypothetical protein [bacterium]